MSYILLEIINSKGWILADGATGTNMFDLWSDLPPGAALEPLCITMPERVKHLHTLFLDKGSDIILTNSFGANACRLKLHGMEDKTYELNRRAAEIARSTASTYNRKILIAGSVGPTGELLQPLGTLTSEHALSVFSKQIIALRDGGVDFIWGETLSSIEEALIIAKASTNAGLPFSICMSFDTAGKTMMGISPSQFVKYFTNSTEYTPIALGANCGVGSLKLLDSIREMKYTGSDIPLIAKGNAGIPEYVGGKIEYNESSEDMALYAGMAHDAGARIIGGCCGTTPNHIGAFYSTLSEKNILRK